MDGCLTGLTTTGITRPAPRRFLYRTTESDCIPGGGGGGDARVGRTGLGSRQPAATRLHKSAITRGPPSRSTKSVASGLTRTGQPTRHDARGQLVKYGTTE